MKRNMQNIDIVFCSDLIKTVGAQLLEISRNGQRAHTMQDMLERFEQPNTWANDRIRGALAHEYPAIQWLDIEFEREKPSAAPSEGDYWMCDPIDGAVQFMQDIPFWSMSLCLIHEGRPVFSLVYDPAQQELFTAREGEGAFLNGVRIQVARKQDLAQSFLATAHPSLPEREMKDTVRTTRAIAHILPQVLAVRMLGTVSLQLAYVACGRLDGYWEYGYDTHDWLAGAFLVRESGGIANDLAGQPFAWGSAGIITGNAAIQSALQARLREIVPE